MTPARPLHLGMAAAMGIALIGFLRATGQAPERPAAAPEVETASAEVPAARSYRELRDSPPLGSQSGWQEGVEALGRAGPGLLDPVSLEGTSKPAELQDRARLRAYDGAPPRIPHQVRQDSAAECLACHDEGLRLRGLLASPVSHAAFASCSQCHVVEQAPMPGGEGLPPDPRAVGNSFVGLASPMEGPRAWTIAPPQIPHRTWLRERCTSCHGTMGREGLRSTHPWRQSCEQCHSSAPDAERRAVEAP